MRDYICDLVSSPTFLKRAPSADELSTLLTTISVYREKYHLQHSQCYWYARAALMKLFWGAKVPEDGNHDEGQIHGSKLSTYDDFHEVCRLYKKRREELSRNRGQFRCNNATCIGHPGLQTTLEQIRGFPPGFIGK